MLLFDLAITGKTLIASIAVIFLGVIALIQIMKMIGRKRAESDLSDSMGAGERKSVLAGRNKYPAVDFFKYSSTFANLGLAIALGVTVLLFGWTQYEPKGPDVDLSLLELEEDIEVAPPRTDEPPPPPPPPPPPVVEEVPDDVVVKDPPKFKSNDLDTKTEVPQDTTHRKKKPKAPAKKKVKKKKVAEVFKVVEQMPRFPGCEDMAGTDAEKKQCADKAMLTFIYKNIKYPAIARENGVEGQVVIQFVVEPDGTVSGVEILRDIGAKCGDEAKRIVELMNKKGIKWTPGRQRGQNVRVQFILPVKFKLN